MKKYILSATMILLFFFALLFLSALVLNSDSDNSLLSAKERSLKLQRSQDPERGEVEEVIVPPERVPKNLSERMRSAAITLLPNHLQAPEARSKVMLSQMEEKKIKRIVSRFLRRWETYRPGDKNWQRGWKPYVASDRVSEIARRRDSTDAPSVCPTRICSVGSRWFGGSPSVFPVDLDEEHIYVVAYGSLRYIGDKRVNPYAGGSTERSYGIILVPTSSAWRIARVAAESLR
jgi:hypothetical protein